MNRTRFHVIRLLIVSMLLLVGSHVALAQGDPAANGAFGVRTVEYNYGDTAFTPTEYMALPGGRQDVEVRAEVYLPDDPAHPGNVPAGRFPVLIFLHGMHSTGFGPAAGDLQGGWPMPAGATPIPNHQGY